MSALNSNQFESHEDPEFSGRSMRMHGRNYPVSVHKDFSDAAPQEGLTRHVVEVPLENGLRAKLLLGAGKGQVNGISPSGEVVYHPDLAKKGFMKAQRGGYAGMGIAHWNGPTSEMHHYIDAIASLPSSAKNNVASKDSWQP